MQVVAEGAAATGEHSLSKQLPPAGQRLTTSLVQPPVGAGPDAVTEMVAESAVTVPMLNVGAV